MKYKQYTSSEIELIKKLATQGASNSFIAKSLNRTISGIISIRSEFGIYSPKIDFLKEAKEISLSRGGECTSKKYIKGTTKLKWKCSEGHDWEATLASVRSGSWCGECYTAVGERVCRVYLEAVFKNKFPRVRPKWLRHPKTGQNLELDGFCEKLKLAFEHQGIQHYRKTSEFTRTDDEFRWQLEKDKFKKKICKEMGVFLFEIPSIPDLTKLNELPNVLQAQIDPKQLKIRFPTIKEIDLKPAFLSNSKEQLAEISKLVAGFGGQILSKEFMGWTRKHHFVCANGHGFDSVPLRIKREGKWCEKCAGVALKTFEEVKLELTPMLEKHAGELVSEVYENGKSKLHFRCRNGHDFETLPVNILKGHWCDKCYRKRRSDDLLGSNFDRAREIIANKGGTLLSNEYSYSRQKLKVHCGVAAHQSWLVDPIQLGQGRWCNRCAIERNAAKSRTPLERQIEIIEQKGGKFISAKGYKNSYSKIEVKCSFGHEFSTSGQNLSQNIWCTKCGWLKSAKSRTQEIEVFQKIAKKRGGLCLSKAYTPDEPLLWQCAEKHEPWRAVASSVKSGSWCPECAKSTMGAYKKLTLVHVKLDAKKYGGVFCDSEYRGSSKKHNYKCKNGHHFPKTPSSVRDGSWCPFCKPNMKRTVEQISEFAEKHGLRFMSSEYLNAKTVYSWKCNKFGHMFDRTYDKIKQLPKCRICLEEIE